MLPAKQKLEKLRRVITENLRVQRSGAPTISYIDVAHALPDAQARQNHVAFGRRGCGKTLLLHEAGRKAGSEERVIYLNCEDFKHHTFPNVLIEILDSVLAEMEQHITGWFGKKKKSQQLLRGLRQKLQTMKTSDDERQERIVEKSTTESAASAKAALGTSGSATADAKVNAPSGTLGLGVTSSSTLSFAGDYAKKQALAVETAYERVDSKIRDLNMLLPEFKKNLGEFFGLSTKVKTLFLHIDDFYHLSRTVQPHVMDYIHRLCKDLPIYFKIATLRHASVLYAERSRQPVGAQERHDYQPINIDFTFQEFPKTEKQVQSIFHEFAELADMSAEEFESLFRGDGFRRLVIAGGGVPRDCLSLFLEALAKVHDEDSRIGKDDVRQLSFSNFERKIEERKT